MKLLTATGRGFSLSILLLLLQSCAWGLQRDECTVRGRVVDEAGKPVAGATIVVDAGPPVGWEDLIGFAAADAEGRFVYGPVYCARRVNRYRLYVTSPIETNALAPVTSPFRRVIAGNRAFMGQPIVVRKQQDLDVGDVRVQIHYGVVNVRLLDQAGAPLLHGANDLQGFVYRVRDKDGKIQMTLGLSLNDWERIVQVETSSMRFALPEGTWSLETSLNGFKGPWLRPNATLKVERGERDAQATLRMSRRRGR